jgi:clan AA aspartic protease
MEAGMAEFSHPITLRGPLGQETLEALVDTGALFTVVPQEVLDRLGARPFDSLPVRLADGRVQTWPLAQVEAEVDGRRRPILVLAGPPGSLPLLGVHALEAFLLTVDPVERRLVPKEAYLM